MFVVLCYTRFLYFLGAAPPCAHSRLLNGALLQ